MNNLDYYKDIYRLKFITRYSNRFRIHDESVAEHSLFVAAIVIKLHDEYDFDLGLALLAAISHDIAESDISDVTHDIKEKHPALKECLQVAELKEIMKYPQLIRHGYNTFERAITVEGLIANLADVIQVMQYVRTEMSLGNSAIEDIELGCIKRICFLKKQLKDAERKP